MSGPSRRPGATADSPEREDAAAAMDAEARAVSARYASRDATADAQRYSLFDAAALAEQQGRLRAMLALWRGHGWSTLAGRDLLEVGCGSGGNLLDLLRCGAEPARIAGLELQSERAAAARALLPPAVRVIEGDALAAPLPDASQDAVLAFTVFSSLLDEGVRRHLAERMWRWLRPGGGVLAYDFTVDNPGNADVRGVAPAAWRSLFPQAIGVRCRRLTLAPPLARMAGRRHPALIGLLGALPPLRTHALLWLPKPMDRDAEIR